MQSPAATSEFRPLVSKNNLCFAIAIPPQNAVTTHYGGFYKNRPVHPPRRHWDSIFDNLSGHLEVYFVYMWKSDKFTA
jgi:hypothetical protein